MLQTNQIYLGDCLSVMQEIDDKSVDLILCDLPYGCTIQKWDENVDFVKLWKEYNRIRKDDCCVLLFGKSSMDAITAF